MALQATADNSLYVRPPFRILETAGIKAEAPTDDRLLPGFSNEATGCVICNEETPAGLAGFCDD